MKDIFKAWLLGLKWPSLPRNDRTPCLIQFVDAAAPPSLLSQLWVQTMQARCPCESGTLSHMGLSQPVGSSVLWSLKWPFQVFPLILVDIYIIFVIFISFLYHLCFNPAFFHRTFKFSMALRSPRSLLSTSSGPNLRLIRLLTTSWHQWTPVHKWGNYW